jgi:putative ABC transport system ATP-binding protein
MNNALEIKNLLFKWNKKDRFSLKIKKLSIERNKKVIMFGESGSGKSTLLNLISGILSPVSGTIIIKDTITNNLSSNKKDSFRANNIGVIFQQFNILDYISPINNIMLPCFFTKFRKKNKNFFYNRAFNLASKLDLEKNILLQKNSSQLSVGQKQRVAIIRAVINKPFLIVADEPTSALDNRNKENFLNLLVNICEAEKITLLMVSHDTSLKKYFDSNITLERIVKK